MAEAAFFRSITVHPFRIESVTADDGHRISELLTTYADLNLGGTDASVVAIAERLDLREIATLDRRHFNVVLFKDAEHFDLAP